MKTVRTKPENLFAKACACYEKGRFQRAFFLFLQGARKGDADCMTRVADMYDNEEGVFPSDDNLDRARAWYRRAIEAGDNIIAPHNLGVSYRRTGDMLKAKECFEQSLAAGGTEAALDLAKMYMICPNHRETVLAYLKILLADEEAIPSCREEAADLVRTLEEERICP